MSDPSPLIELQSVSKSFMRGQERICVLDHLSLQAATGDFLALMGPSGSGKTTLLNIIAGIDRADSGAVHVGGRDLFAATEAELTAWRAKTLGFVFQFYNLIPVLSAAENVALPLTLFPMSSKERLARAKFALEIVGLGDRAAHRPAELSGGQEQRVAIARAVVTDPAIIVADEPTGDLDRQSATEIMHLLTRLNREFKKTIVMVTHDQEVAKFAGRIVRLDKGTLAND